MFAKYLCIRCFGLEHISCSVCEVHGPQRSDKTVHHYEFLLDLLVRQDDSISMPTLSLWVEIDTSLDFLRVCKYITRKFSVWQFAQWKTSQPKTKWWIDKRGDCSYCKILNRFNSHFAVNHFLKVLKRVNLQLLVCELIAGAREADITRQAQSGKSYKTLSFHPSL